MADPNEKTHIILTELNQKPLKWLATMANQPSVAGRSKFEALGLLLAQTHKTPQNQFENYVFCLNLTIEVWYLPGYHITTKKLEDIQPKVKVKPKSQKIKSKRPKAKDEIGHGN